MHNCFNYGSSRPKTQDIIEAMAMDMPSMPPTPPTPSTLNSYAAHAPLTDDLADTDFTDLDGYIHRRRTPTSTSNGKSNPQTPEPAAKSKSKYLNVRIPNPKPAVTLKKQVRKKKFINKLVYQLLTKIQY